MLTYKVTHDGVPDPIFVEAPTRKAAIYQAWDRLKANGSRMSYGAFSASATAVTHYPTSGRKEPEMPITKEDIKAAEMQQTKVDESDSTVTRYEFVSPSIKRMKLVHEMSKRGSRITRRFYFVDGKRCKDLDDVVLRLNRRKNTT